MGNRKNQLKKEAASRRVHEGPAGVNPPAPPNPTVGLASLPAEPSLDHRFNDDLLIQQGDRDLVNQLYPDLAHVLDYPQLRAHFVRYNEMANHAKKRVHRRGMLAVVASAVALLSSAVTPIVKTLQEIPDLNSSTLLTLHRVQQSSIVAEVLGLIGAAIAIGGMFISNWKKKWLEGRLMTERLRQWQFQLLIHRGQEVEASCEFGNPDAKAHFLKLRDEWFAVFVHQHEGGLDATLHELVEAPESRYISLHDGQSTYPEGSNVLLRIFEAYRYLRLRHQAGYAAYKLQKTTNKPLWKPHTWPITVLLRRLEMITSICLICALAVSFFIVVGHLLDWPLAHSPALPALILCLLVLNAATRGMQDGLAVREEAQRYADYGGEVRYLLTRFEASRDVEEKLRLMQDMERTVVDELKGFLRSHMEAKFIV